MDSETILNAFLRRFAADLEAGAAAPLAEYQRIFAGHDDLIAGEYERLSLNAEAPAETPKTVRADSPGGDGAALEPGDVPPGFEILGCAGRGGMGVVYRAREVDLDRIVALKMILLGPYAGEEAGIRFRTEALAAARLRHPNIVQIHSFGEHRGRPYFALEFVPGGSLASRLDGTPWEPARAAALVETLARAMASAHERGIVHRDLKPGNVLLDEDGTPKIADFGLAKLLDAKTDATMTGSTMGTPSYMAPEQAEGRGGDVGPAADVYALGAILYELLVGRPPFRAPTVLETLRLVSVADPVPPSRLQPGLPKDAGTIALKCLEKAVDRRYGSAAALAEDLRRFRANEPVLARPAGRVERLRKLARRRPAAAALALVSGVALLTLAGLGFWSYQRIRSALADVQTGRTRARASFERAREAYARLTDLAQERLAHVPRFEEERRTLLAEALAFYEGLDREIAAEPAVRAEVARVRASIGGIEEMLGRTAEAEASLAAGLAAREALLRELPGDPGRTLEVARGEREFAGILGSEGRASLGLEHYDRALGLADALALAHPSDDAYSRERATIGYDRGLVYVKVGRTADAEPAFRKTVEILESLAKKTPGDLGVLDDLGAAHLSLASMLFESGRPRPALAEADEALRCKDRLATTDRALRPRNRIELARLHGTRAQALAALNDGEGAEKALRKAAEIEDRLAADFPAAPEYRVLAARAHEDLADRLLGSDRPEEGKAERAAAIGILQKLVRDFPERAVAKATLADACGELGGLLAGDRALSEAAAFHERAAGLWRGLTREQPKSERFREKLVRSTLDLGRVLADMGDRDRAKRSATESVDAARALAASSPGVLEHHRALGISLDALADVLAKEGSVAAAEAAWREAVLEVATIVESAPERTNARYNLAAILGNFAVFLAERGRADEALAAYDRGIGLLEALEAAEGSSDAFVEALANGFENRGNLRRVVGRAAESEADLRASVTRRERLFDAARRSADRKSSLFRTLYNLALTLEATGKTAEARDVHQRTVGGFEALTRENPEVPEYGSTLASALNNLGWLELGRGEEREAEREFRRSIAVKEPLVGKHPDQVQWRSDLACTLDNLADMLRKRGDTVEARGLYEKALDHEEAAYRANPENPSYAKFLRSHLEGLADVLIGLGENDRGVARAEDLGKLDAGAGEECFLAARLLARAAARAPEGRRKALRDAALGWLRKARTKGAKDVATLRSSADFEGVRADPGFAAILAEYEGAESRP